MSKTLVGFAYCNTGIDTTVCIFQWIVTRFYKEINFVPFDFKCLPTTFFSQPRFLWPLPSSLLFCPVQIVYNYIINSFRNKRKRERNKLQITHASQVEIKIVTIIFSVGCCGPCRTSITLIGPPGPVFYWPIVAWRVGDIRFTITNWFFVARNVENFRDEIKRVEHWARFPPCPKAVGTRENTRYSTYATSKVITWLTGTAGVHRAINTQIHKYIQPRCINTDERKTRSLGWLQRGFGVWIVLLSSCDDRKLSLAIP